MINETINVSLSGNFKQVVIENMSWISKDLNGLRYKCEIDTINIIDSLQSFPKIPFYFLLFALTITLLYILIPKIEEYIKSKDIMFLIFITLLATTFFYSFITFNITSEIFKKTIEPLLYILSGIGLIYILWKERKNIKEFINNIKKD